MKLVLLIVFCSVARLCTAVTQANKLWVAGYDSVSDYEQVGAELAASRVQCTALASRLSGVQLATYSASTALCRMFRCRLSLIDCRKCRNQLNPSSDQVWTLSSNATPCWTTLQHRVSASFDFYRAWADYKVGFGEGANLNYWIGLDAIRALTSATPRKMRLVFKSWNGSESWVQYSSFLIGPDTDYYRLSVSGFTSSHPTIGDSLGPMNNCQFSTWDRDNDGVTTNIAQSFHGAWWFNGASRSHPNGLYQVPPTAFSTPYGQGIIWLDPFGPYYSLMEVEMLVL